MQVAIEHNFLELILHLHTTCMHPAPQEHELVELLVSWGVPRSEAISCFDGIMDQAFDLDQEEGNLDDMVLQHATKSLSKEDFFLHCEPIWRFQASMMKEAVSFSRAFASYIRRRTLKKKLCRADSNQSLGARGQAQEIPRKT